MFLFKQHFHFASFSFVILMIIKKERLGRGYIVPLNNLSFFYYCNLVQASTYKTCRLIILQKGIIRIYKLITFQRSYRPHVKGTRNSVCQNLMIFICFNQANLCILAKIHSCIQSFITINSTLTILEIPRPTVYPFVEQTLRCSQLFFSRAEVFLIKLITKSSTLDRFPPSRKY